MRFLMEFMACCGSYSSTSMVKEEARLLVASVPPPSSETCRIRGRKSCGRRNSSGEWRPSLSSIREDNVLCERNKNEPHPHHEEVTMAAVGSSPSSNLKRKITSTPRTRSYCPREDVRKQRIWPDLDCTLLQKEKANQWGLNQEQLP